MAKNLTNIDFFISHSREIKQNIAIPLAQTLSALGFNVWLDKKGILTGDDIFKEIKEAISKSKYCIALIDTSFLSREWPKKEIELFSHREKEEERIIIFPIYIDTKTELVYKAIPHLKNRAFEMLKNEFFNRKLNLDIVSRIIERFFDDSSIAHLEKAGNEIINYSFPCKDTLFTLLSCKQYYSNDLRLATMEICNIGGLVIAIYNALAPSKNKTLEICLNFCNTLRDGCFNVDYPISYSMYNAATKVVISSMNQLKSILDVK